MSGNREIRYKDDGDSFSIAAEPLNRSAVYDDGRGRGSFDAAALQRTFRAPAFSRSRKTTVTVPELPWKRGE